MKPSKKSYQEKKPSSNPKTAKREELREGKAHWNAIKKEVKSEMKRKKR